MIALYRLARVRAQVEAFEDVERGERTDPLAVGGEFPHVKPAIARAERLDPGARVRGEVGRRQVAAGLQGEARDPPGQLSLVEVVGVALGDPAQRCRVIGEGTYLTGARSVPLRREG